MADIDIEHRGGAAVNSPSRWPGALHRVSWGAVFAGLVIATALQVVFTVLGAAVGLTALEGATSGRAFGIGAAVWALLVPLITLFVGGMTAGRLAGVRDRFDGFIHGALVWGLSLLLAVWLLGTGASRVLGGTLSLAGDLAGTAVSSAGAVASRSDLDLEALRNAPERIAEEARARGITEEQVRQELAAVQQRAGDVADTTQDAAAGGAWLALLALGLSLAAAAFGALRAVRDDDRVRTTAAV